jgi:hypothetical protein
MIYKLKFIINLILVGLAIKNAVSAARRPTTNFKRMSRFRQSDAHNGTEVMTTIWPLTMVYARTRDDSGRGCRNLYGTYPLP